MKHLLLKQKLTIIFLIHIESAIRNMEIIVTWRQWYLDSSTHSLFQIELITQLESLIINRVMITNWGHGSGFAKIAKLFVLRSTVKRLRFAKSHFKIIKIPITL